MEQDTQVRADEAYKINRIHNILCVTLNHLPECFMVLTKELRLFQAFMARTFTARAFLFYKCHQVNNLSIEHEAETSSCVDSLTDMCF